MNKVNSHTQEKHVLITGASSGIGRSITEFLSGKGFKIYAGARRQSDIEELNKINNVRGIKLDVTDTGDIENLVNIIEEKGSGLFAIINNAGIAVAGPLMDITDPDMRAQFDVNFFGIHNVTGRLFPYILKSGGRIIMNSSDSGYYAAPFFGPYCASKFALEGYSDALRRELLIYGVKVIIIQSVYISTPIWDKGENLLDKFKDSMFEKEAKEIGKFAIEKGKTRGLPPVKVAEAVFKSLTRKNPKNRYLIAKNHLESSLMKILPGKIIDRRIRKEIEKIKKSVN